MEITLTFLTPAFLYGGSQTRPEFRIPSLIGQMRYWWRMTQDWSKIEKMRDREAKIFGLGEDRAKPFYVYVVSPNLSEGRAKEQNKSKNQWLEKESLPDNFENITRAHPKLSYNNNKQKLFYNGFMSDQEFKNLTAKFGWNNKTKIEKLYNKAHRYVFSNEQDGLSYLFYPFNQNRQEIFSWLAPGSKVLLNFEFLKKKEEIKTDILLSLFLLSRFGGLGSRSRRGAGAIEISSEECALFGLTESDLRKYINNTKNGQEGDNSYFAMIKHQSPLFKALENSTRFKFKVKPESSWAKTLNFVGTEMMNFRTKQKMRTGSPGRVHLDFVKEAVELHGYYNTGNKLSKDHLTKDAFGLPRIVNFSDAMGALTIVPYDEKGNERRRASPLHITVNKSNTGQYSCSLLIFWDGLCFLPSDIKIRINKNRSSKYTELQNPGAKKLEEFLRRV